MKEVDIDKLALELAGGLSLDQLRQRQEKRFSAPKTEPITERGKEHLARLAMERQNAIPKVHAQIGQEMSYEEARKSFWGIMGARAFELSTIENREFEWDVSTDLASIIKSMLQYFINDPQSEYPLNKGLFICGLPGTGKSEFMEMFSRFCTDNKLSKEFKISSLSSIHTRAKSDKDFDPIMPYVQFNRCFDEFGRHIGPIVRFGDSLNINEAIIEERYERNKRYGQITHFVANMTPNEVKDLFPPMIFDRIRAMCSSVVFPGESKRK